MLNNSNNSYSGGTIVSAGSLLIGGTAADSNSYLYGTVNVSNGGTLGGYGSVSNAIIESGGKLKPGGSDIGSFYAKEAQFMQGSIFEVRVNPDGTSDRLNAFYDVQIAPGANLSLLSGAGTWNDTTTYTIINTASGFVQGTFTNIGFDLAFLTPTVDYNTPNQVNVTMARNGNSFSQIGNTYNEKGTGAGIESLGASNPVYQQILSMNALQANNAYNNLSGEIHASVKSALLENSRYSRHAILEHLDQTTTQTTPQTGQNLWIKTWAHDGYLRNDNNAARMNNKGAGIMLGADLYQEGATTVGAALGYEHTDVKIGDSRRSNADAQAIHLMGYGQTKLDPIDLKAGIGYSWLNIDSKRHVAVGSLMSKNKAKYDAGLVQLFTEGSHTFKVNEQVQLAPYAGLLYQRINAGGFTEKGVAGQLHARRSSDHSTSTTLGVRGLLKINPSSNLYVDMGWKHTFGKRGPDTTLNFVGGSAYNIKGVQTNRNSALIGMGANFELHSNISLNVGYDGQIGNQSTDHGIKAGVEFKF